MPFPGDQRQPTRRRGVRTLDLFMSAFISARGSLPDGLVITFPKVSTVSQDDKAFQPSHIALAHGERLWIVNNDSRTHNVRIFDPALDFDSGAQEPGETVEISFPAAGPFLVFCGIHPKMELYVDVAP